MEAQEAGPKVERVFRKMLNEPYNGRVKLSHLSEMSSLDFPANVDCRAAIIWFQDNADTFATFRNDKGRVVMVGIKLAVAKLCENYLQQKNNNDVNNCSDANCKLLHLCTGCFDQHCNEEECQMIHSFTNDHNKRILDLPVFNKYGYEDQLKIIRLSQPEVCRFYNNDGVCNHRDNCTRLHVCRKFLLGQCNDSQTLNGCPLSHSLTSTHSLHLLQIFSIWYNPDNLPDVYCQILAPIAALGKTKHTNFKSSISQAGIDLSMMPIAQMFKPENDIIEDLDMKNLKTSDDIDKNKSTNKLLKEFEYETISNLWSVEFIGTWVYFDKKVDEMVEHEFCNPNSSKVIIKVPHEIQEYLPECQEMTLNLDMKTAILDDGHQTLPMKRCEPPENSSKLIYLWYYLNQNGQWEVLDQNDAVEKAFKMDEKRLQIISDDGRMLRVKYQDMTLKDRNTGKVHQLRRRPLRID